METLADPITSLSTYSLQQQQQQVSDTEIQQKHYKLLVKDDHYKDQKASIFQYEKLMGLIEKNRKSFTKAAGPEYMDMLQKDFHNLKKRT